MSTHNLHQLIEQAERWIADDPDEKTRADLTTLLHTAGSPDDELDEPRAQAFLELEDRFSGLLQFGTAGLRGAMAAGPNRMNRAVVIRAAAGLAAYLLTEVRTVTGDEDAVPRVAIGYDARHNSHAFAIDTAAVLTAAGIEALLLDHALPTPVLAFAVRHLSADAGVMVTASHNPPADNGYKVYLGGRVVVGSGRGAQIVPPFDAQIAERISAVDSVASVPRSTDGWTVVGPDLLTDYLASVGRLADDAAPRNLSIVATPLHGVGGAVLQSVLHTAGYRELVLVPEQAEPDPDFSTVAFPNPEEPGAIDLALAYAQTLDADLVVANDPDADRCAIAVRDPRAAQDLKKNSGSDTARAEGWRMLHGDEVGALLGELVAAEAANTPGAFLASSIVSSRLLARIAESHGLQYASTLTGFKWISRVDGLVFGYEEALGYCVDPGSVRDKDGLSAALLLVQLADRLKARGRTLVDELDRLARIHGLHLTDQLSLRFANLARIPETMARLREAPPTTLAGSPVTEIVDLAEGSALLPPTDGLRLVAEDGTRVIVRPSGTEPKVKCYLEVIVPLETTATDEQVASARHTARARLDAVRADMSAALEV
ncbi:phospho-sugar mutase [Sanguibacter antarcticus]|uniref:Phosphomannomutase n=1 Tax=Sanguibacter antarcticus TaxID=372484 RepID=A0A2A9E501_9MICO|nr:phospho-sugar mutase [Sanguibacter antarcticus]PFG33716.1 phosphomannomutase [Sanguibacter antarcticus]